MVLPTRVYLNKSSITFTSLYSTETLTAGVLPTNTVYSDVQWSSSNSKVAGVSPSGTVTAKAKGSAVIKATTKANGLTTTCNVTVEPHYDVDKAVAWAAAHFDKAPSFKKYVGDTTPNACHPFVALCLAAGGYYDYDPSTGTKDAYDAIYNDFVTNIRKNTHDYPGQYLEKDDLFNGEATFEKTRAKLKTGDIVVIDRDLGAHVMLCLGYDANWYARYACWNPPLGHVRYTFNPDGVNPYYDPKAPVLNWFGFYFKDYDKDGKLTDLYQGDSQYARQPNVISMSDLAIPIW
jgi:hypothetical protein